LHADQIKAGDIDLEPEYRRGAIYLPTTMTGKFIVIADVVCQWPESKQIMFIDSILRLFYILPVLFAVKNHNDGSESKTCIDGAQRLTSIHRFVPFIYLHI